MSLTKDYSIEYADKIEPHPYDVGDFDGVMKACFVCEQYFLDGEIILGERYLIKSPQQTITITDWFHQRCYFVES